MTPILTQPAASPIDERAMLVDLTIRSYVPTKNDRKVSREVAEQHGADPSVGRYTKKLLAGFAPLDDLRKIGSEGNAEHRRLTLPWLDSGARILASAGYFHYTEVMRAIETRWWAAVDAFCAGLPNAILDDQYKLNGLFDPGDYPDAQLVRDKFSFGYNVFPLPTAGDFRIDLGELETRRVQARIEEQTNAAIEAAMRDVWERMRVVVGHMVERLWTYRVTAEGVSGKFHDTLVENIRDLVDILPTLNVTENAAMAELNERMRAELCRYSAQTLRDSHSARESTVAAAEDILHRIEAFAA